MICCCHKCGFGCVHGNSIITKLKRQWNNSTNQEFLMEQKAQVKEAKMKKKEKTDQRSKQKAQGCKKII